MTSKLADSHTALKVYWALLTCLLYNKKDTRNTLTTDGKFVPDFYEKANI